MTRLAIDSSTALRIIREKTTIADGHQLVGPASLRSHVLAALYTDMRRGVLDEKAAREQLEALAALKIRLLGDRVSRAAAWRIATSLDWDDISPAEYLAVASLQADALITQDDTLRAGAQGIIPLAEFEDLSG